MSTASSLPFASRNANRGPRTSLTEAQRMTSVYAKMEYGVKRLLWLGS